MRIRQWLIGTMAMGALAGPGMAAAANYTANCGSGGDAAVVQAQINAIETQVGSILTVTGTCVGDLSITRAESLSISGLNLNGSLTITLSRQVALSNLTIKGSVLVNNTRRARFYTMTGNAEVLVTNGSEASFDTITLAADASAAPSISCAGQSQCQVSALSLTGAGAANGSVGLLGASASRVTLNGGTISGFDIGVQAWNNSIVFLSASCDPVNVQGNRSMGVYATDGGIAKLAGVSAADAPGAGCPGPVLVTVANNGNVGVQADGGGNAYLYQTSISGHTLDGIRVKHGSTVRVQSSTLDAATVSGRSARVQSQAHLYFDEQTNGPGAGSTLAGPVCVVGNSTVDTDNSSTVVTTTPTCSGP